MSAPSTAPLIIINESNLNTGIVVKENKLIYANYYWHKIFVQNAIKYSRDFVLRTIMNAVHPLDFIPVCYDIEGEYVTFLLKNCGAAINELCRLNLTIPHPDVQKNLPPFKIAIALKHSHASELKIEIQNNISTILKRRYNTSTKTLNLEAFVKDPDLIEFCPLSQPKLMYFVLHLSRDHEVECLKLNLNDIEMLKPLEALNHERCFKSLSIIDLRKNNIRNFEQLSALKSFPITEITLEDNPLAENLTEQEYVKEVREYCPKITKLDGCRVPPVGMLALRRNFLCNSSGQIFVDQFLEHFFSLYDSTNRSLLANMYHKQAMFSLTSQYTSSGATNASNVKLYEYKKYSRNVKMLSDLSKNKECLFCGSANIGNMLKTLPLSEHDPYTFTVDLTQFSEKNAVVTVTGVFKEPGKNLSVADFFFGFTRTFVLAATGNMEFNIVNDMLHVSNATLSQQARAFKIVKVPRSTVLNIPVATSENEKNEMINAFVSLTHLRPEWATKCLKECEYNLKNAIALFMDLFKADKFPGYAFDFSDMEVETLPEPFKPINPEDIRAKLQPIEKIIRIKPVSALTASVIASQHGANKAGKVQMVPAPQAHKSANITIPMVQHSGWQIPTQTSVSAGNTQPLTNPKSVSQSSSSSSSKSNKRKNSENKDVGEDFLISADADDLKKYVKDPILLLALNMAPDALIEKVRDNLDAASKHILRTYTYALKYYKAIGREYYRYQLYSEARKFLTEAMAIVPKQMGEQLYSLFTLFEIQHGDINISESMILVIAESFQENKTASFISDEVAKINTSFARKLFAKIAISNLPVNKKKVLLDAYVDFEAKYGNVENLKQANKTKHDNTIKAEPMDDTDEARTEKMVQPAHGSEKPSDSTPQPHSVINLEIAPYSKPKTDLQFAEFRERYLITSGLLPPKTPCSELAHLQLITDKDKAIKLSETIIRQYKTDIYIIKCVCKVLIKFNLSDLVKQQLEGLRVHFKSDDKALNALILYFNVVEHIQHNQYAEAKQLIFQLIRIATYANCCLVFEELVEDFIEKNQQFLDDILKEGASSVHFVLAKRKLLTLLYKMFCLRIDSTYADPFYKEHFCDVQPFYPEDIAKLDFIKKIRSRYENSPPDFDIENIMRDFNLNCLEGQIEEMRMYFYLQMPSRARNIRNKFKNKYQQDIDNFKVAAAYYEGIYGTPSVGVNLMRKITPETFNTCLACIHCLRQTEHVFDDVIKAKCKKVFKDALFAINPYTQGLLFKYHKEWMKQNFDIFEWRKKIILPGD